jgi:hypothetical protein
LCLCIWISAYIYIDTNVHMYTHAYISIHVYIYIQIKCQTLYLFLWNIPNFQVPSRFLLTIWLSFQLYSLFLYPFNMAYYKFIPMALIFQNYYSCLWPFKLHMITSIRFNPHEWDALIKRTLEWWINVSMIKTVMFLLSSFPLHENCAHII